MSVIFCCEKCEAPVLADDICWDGENCLCEPCVTKWANEEFRRVTGWTPPREKEAVNA
jgi:hypothetical protein